MDNVSTSTRQRWLWNILSWSHTLHTAVASAFMISHNCYCCFSLLFPVNFNIYPRFSVCVSHHLCNIFKYLPHIWMKQNKNRRFNCTHTNKLLTDSVEAEQLINKIKPQHDRWYIYFLSWNVCAIFSTRFFLHRREMNVWQTVLCCVVVQLISSFGLGDLDLKN